MAKVFADNINLGNKTLKTTKTVFESNELITKSFISLSNLKYVDFFYRGFLYEQPETIFQSFSSDFNLKKIFLRCGTGSGEVELRSGADGTSLLGVRFVFDTTRREYSVDEMIQQGWPLVVECYNTGGSCRDLSISFHEA